MSKLLTVVLIVAAPFYLLYGLLIGVVMGAYLGLQQWRWHLQRLQPPQPWEVPAPYPPEEARR